MSDKIKMIVIGVVALIVGAAGGGGYGMMQVDEVTQKLMAATQEKDQAVQNALRLRKLSDDSGKKIRRWIWVNSSWRPAHRRLPPTPAARAAAGTRCRRWCEDDRQRPRALGAARRIPRVARRRACGDGFRNGCAGGRTRQCVAEYRQDQGLARQPQEKLAGEGKESRRPPRKSCWVTWASRKRLRHQSLALHRRPRRPPLHPPRPMPRSNPTTDSETRYAAGP